MSIYSAALSNGHAAGMTVAGVIRTYLAHDTTPGRSAVERRKILAEFVERYGETSIDVMRPADLVFWVNERKSWKSDWTKNRVISIIQRPFNWACRLQLAHRNPFAGIQRPQGQRGRPMTDDEFSQILRNSTPCFRRAVIAIRYNGMRCGELAALEWAHLDFQRQCAILPQHKTIRTRKDRRPRLIVFHPVVWRLVLWIRRTQPRCQCCGKWVFTNRDGRKWSRASLDIRLLRIRKKLGIPNDCKLHSARHAFGKQAAENGVGLASIAELLGHTTLEMAKYYVDLYGATDHLRSAVAKAAGRSGVR